MEELDAVPSNLGASPGLEWIASVKARQQIF